MRKNSGVAPSVAALVDKCPQATENPGTGEPFTPKHTYEAFRSYCYDEGSAVPGDHQDPVQKTALPPFLIAARHTWAQEVKKAE